MDQQYINKLIQRAEVSDDPSELRIIGKQLQDLGQTDLAAFAFHKAQIIEQDEQRVNG